MDHASSKIVPSLDGHKRLACYNAVQGRVVIQTIREEEEFMKHLDKIIQRDYFPDLTNPENIGRTSPELDAAVSESWKENESRNPEKADPTAVPLDKYLANNTTEDDASFVELIEESEKKQRIKLSSFFPSNEAATIQAIANEPKPLALPGGAQVQVGPRLTLTAGNAVHFNPDGVPQTQEEFLQHLAKERRIVPSNTRFKRPLPVTFEKKISTKQALFRKIGLDGKELYSTLSTPQAGGFKFMDASPSPAMSAFGTSPLMTWGHLDSTPARLDDGPATPSVISGVPAFRIPSPSKREQLAHRLADKASRQRTRDRNEAVKRVQSGMTSPSIALLSPAARRLLASSSGRIASSSRPGTGSSTSFANSPRTKSITPFKLASGLGIVSRSASLQRTPLSQSPAVSSKTNVKIPVQSVDSSSDKLAAVSSQCDDLSNSQSITDNLLNLRSMLPQTPAHTN